MTTLSANTQLIEERIQKLCDTLVEKFYKQYNDPVAFEVKRGVKYYKIIHVHSPGSKYEGRNVHAFVARQTGTIYKPASWQAPAKHARYQLLDDHSFETCLSNCDYAGSYLYMK